MSSWPMVVDELKKRYRCTEHEDNPGCPYVRIGDSDPHVMVSNWKAVVLVALVSEGSTVSLSPILPPEMSRELGFYGGHASWAFCVTCQELFDKNVAEMIRRVDMFTGFAFNLATDDATTCRAN